MLYREIIAVCSQIHTEHINTLCGQNVEYLNALHSATCPDYCALNGWTVDSSLQTVFFIILL